MKKLSEVITKIAEVTENKALTVSMLDKANSYRGTEMTVRYSQLPIAETHPSEGVYEISVKEDNPAVKRILSDISHHGYSLHKFGMEEGKFINAIRFFISLTVNEIAERKTDDGRKLWKAIKSNLTTLEKGFWKAFENESIILEQCFINPDLDGEMHLRVISDVKSSIESRLKNLKDLKETLDTLFALDQQNKTGLMDKKVWARISFRRQDVLGMTHLGRFSSCQKIHHGFSSHATHLVSSVKSESLGTITIHDNKISALARDTHDDEFEFGYEDKASARDNLIMDSNGQIIVNDSPYTESHTDSTILYNAVQELIGLDVLQSELSGSVNLYEDTTYISEEYEFSRNVDFNVTGNISINGIYDAVIQELDSDDEDDAELIEVLEGDEYDLETKLDMIDDAGHLDIVREEIKDTLENVDTCDSYYTLYDEDGREIELSDHQIIDIIDTDDVIEMMNDYVDCADTSELYYLIMNDSYMCDMDVDYTDTIEDEKELTPYPEGRLTAYINY